MKKMNPENVQNYTVQERFRTEQKLKSLIRVSQYLSAIVNLNELLEKIVDSAVEVVGAERGFLMLYKGVIEGVDIDSGDKGELVLTVSKNVSKDALSSEAFQTSKAVMDKVLAHGEAVVITDAASDEEFKSRNSVVRYGLRSILCVPLKTKNNQMMGLLYLDNRLVKGLFGVHELDLLTTLALQAGISVENIVLAEKEKAAVRKASEAEVRGKYADMLAEKNKELEKAYDKLKLTQGQLVQSAKMASVGQLATGVAHEINNPTGFMLSNLEMLEKYHGTLQDVFAQYAKIDEFFAKRGDEESRSMSQSLEVLKKKLRMNFILSDLPSLVEESKLGALRIKKIVEDLRTFSHVDEEKRQNSNINEVVDFALNIVWNELKYKVQVVKEYSDLPLFLCYPHEMNQVFVNLLINACQAIEDKGTITIRTYLKDPDVVVEVEDTGCGMGPEVLGRLFEPFFTTKPVGKGTGLGLSVVYGIIKRHKGEISVKSQPGEGSTFTIRLPFQTASA
ncbi:MAG: GAF domain-containing protein [Candidatus Omnitrophica bacterium]|nr:GAF domain-containing protein [Candidatus Omnitrophota bacterium]